VIRLNIKGPQAVAERELVARHMLYTVEHERGYPNLGPDYKVTTVTVDSVYHDRVFHWFGEGPDKPPFPEGSLLHYTNMGDDAG
jgi:hypothetical protein